MPPNRTPFGVVKGIARRKRSMRPPQPSLMQDDSESGKGRPNPTAKREGCRTAKSTQNGKRKPKKETGRGKKEVAPTWVRGDC